MTIYFKFIIIINSIKSLIIVIFIFIIIIKTIIIIIKIISIIINSFCKIRKDMKDTKYFISEGGDAFLEIINVVTDDNY